MKTATYLLRCIDTDEPTPSMDAPGIVSMTPGNQDSGRVRFTVVTTDAAALVVALENDDSVLAYERTDA